MNADSIVTRYLAIWNETDTAKRRALVRDAFTEDCTYTDPLGAVRGTAGVDAFVAGVQSQFAGVTFDLSGKVDAHHDQLRFTWHAKAPGMNEPAAIGFDVAVLDNGKIRHIYGFLDKAPA